VVPVTVTHAGGTTNVDLDQRIGGGYTSIGEFDVDGSVTVVLDASTVAGTVIADALALRPIDTTTTTSGAGGGTGAGGDSTGAGAGSGAGSGGEDGAGAGASASGPTSSSGANGSSPVGVGGGDAGDDAAEDDGGGCDCRIDRAGGAPSGPAIAAFAALAYVGLARRRRR